MRDSKVGGQLEASARSHGIARLVTLLKGSGDFVQCGRCGLVIAGQDYYPLGGVSSVCRVVHVPIVVLVVGGPVKRLGAIRDCGRGGVLHGPGMSDRFPYVGVGADGALRSAQIDREEADTLARDDPRRDELLSSAEVWERQAARFGTAE